MDTEHLVRSSFRGAEDGLRTTAELRTVGLERDAIATLVRRGVVTRVTAGYYALADASPEEPSRAGLVALVRRGRALERRYAHRVVASHHLAVAMAGLPVYGAPLDVAHLTYRQAGCCRQRSDHLVHAAPTGLVVARGPMPIAEALVQCGATWGEDAFAVAADQALRAGLVSREDLAGVVAARPEAPRHPLLVHALGRLDEHSESAGESLLRLRLLDQGLALESQVEVRVGGRQYRVDLVIVGTKVAIEFDGMLKYADLEDAARVKRAEKAREEALRTVGWVVVRFQWADLFHPEEIRRRIEWALEIDRRQRAS